MKSVLLILAAYFMLVASPVNAQESVVIATVNDKPITSFDVDQRIRLLRTLGQTGPSLGNRKKIANDLINDVIKIQEAKLNKLDATPGEVEERLKRIAASMQTDQAGLVKKLKAQGISLSTFSQYTAAQMAFSRLLSAKYREKVSIDPSAVDQKMNEIKSEINGKLAKIKADPRMQSITVFSILEVNFPVEGNDPQLMQSRAIEAGQYAQKFNSCANPRGPASGIFNVQVGKKFEADSRKLPPALRKLLEKSGPNHAYGPMRGQGGVQVIAYCGKRLITPQMPKAQMPTRDQIENVVLNEKYGEVEQKYVAIMRKHAIIEYKDQSYAQ
jgi:peptidyl-prolyl cis-trans isomerase SurA